jgi:excisionase family DNA binding protein
MKEGDRAGQFHIPELVDIETVAMLLGVGQRYVRRLVAERQIEIVKVGHYVRFDLQVVRKWVEDRRRPAESAPG